jgi:3-methyladenine DNA glycosylase/8-oxoguanine DNA glycosylase
MPVDLALAEWQQLPGVGPWTASHILFRGAALRDAVPTVEPRPLHGLADAYGIAAPSVEALLEIAEKWRPFRMWICVLLARHLANAGGWHRPGLVGGAGGAESPACACRRRLAGVIASKS